MSRRLRKGLPEFSRVCLVAVQLGPAFWSEECMGIAGDELIFIKPTQLGRSKRLRLPLSVIREARTFPSTCLPFHTPGLRGLIISTFSRQYTLMIRASEEICHQWVQTLLSARGTESSRGDVNHPQNVEPSPTPRSKALSASLRLSFRRRFSGGFSGNSNPVTPEPAATSTKDAGAGQNGSGENGNTSLPMLHMELLVRPRGWRLGERVVLNNRAFICV